MSDRTGPEEGARGLGVAEPRAAAGHRGRQPAARTSIIPRTEAATEIPIRFRRILLTIRLEATMSRNVGKSQSLPLVLIAMITQQHRRATPGHITSYRSKQASPTARHSRYCNMSEAPWLVNGGHGASLRHHKASPTARRSRASAARWPRRGRATPRPSRSSGRPSKTQTEESVNRNVGESQSPIQSLP
jgi:hypothetical protein